AESPAKSHEPDEPELRAASQAAFGADSAPLGQPRTPMPSEAETELLSEAADTFEQAYEERLPPEAPHLLDQVLDAPARRVSGTEAAEAKANATRLIGDLVRDIEPEKASSSEGRPPLKLERLQKILSQAG